MTTSITQLSGLDGLPLPEALAKTKPDKPNSSLSRTIWQPPAAGVPVDEHIALTNATVWACVRVVTDIIMGLPIDIIEMQSNGSQSVIEGTPEGHVLNRVANPETAAPVFRQTHLAHAMLWGGGYAEIENTRLGELVATHQITPDRVTPTRNDVGEFVYDVTQSGGGKITLRANEMIHTKGLGFDGLVGYSVVRMAKEAIALGLATEKFGSTFFGNGARPSLALQHPGTMSDPAFEHLRESWYELHGGPANSNKVAILEEGVTIQAFSIPPEDAQFLETRTFQIREIGPRWFGVPPPFLGDLADATYANVNQLFIFLVTGAIMPWIQRYETEMTFKLFAMRGSDLRVKIQVNGLLRGDLKARSEFYKSMRDLGVFSPNDILRLEDRNELGEEGDIRLVPMNMTRLEDAGTQPNTAPSPNTGSPPNSRMAEALVPALEAAANKIASKESKALRTAMNKDTEGIRKWAQGWFRANHTEALLVEFGVPLKAVATIRGVEDPTPGVVQRHIEAAETEVMDAADVGAVELVADQWRDSRAAAITEILLRAAGLEKDDDNDSP